MTLCCQSHYHNKRGNTNGHVQLILSGNLPRAEQNWCCPPSTTSLLITYPYYCYHYVPKLDYPGLLWLVHGCTALHTLSILWSSITYLSNSRQRGISFHFLEPGRVNQGSNYGALPLLLQVLPRANKVAPEVWCRAELLPSFSRSCYSQLGPWKTTRIRDDSTTSIGTTVGQRWFQATLVHC